MMYLRYFGLEKNAFSLSPDPAFLYLTEKHREALAALLFGVTASKGFVVVTGDAGTGKTTLIRKLLSSLPASKALFSILVNPLLTEEEFLEAVLLGFGERQVPTSKALRLGLLRRLLLQAYHEEKSAVLVIDEAHLLTGELLEEVRLLSNFETSERKLLQVVLLGQNELGPTLNHPSLRQLKQRIGIRVHLKPLAESEVAGYLQARWRMAASRQPLPFTPEAVQLMARSSAGIPRTLNILSDAALVNAYGAGSTVIGTGDVQEVLRDLDLQPAADSDGVLGFAQRTVISQQRSIAAAPARADASVTAVERVVIRPPADAERLMAEPHRRPAPGRIWRFSNWFGAESSGN